MKILFGERGLVKITLNSDQRFSRIISKLANRKSRAFMTGRNDEIIIQSGVFEFTISESKDTYCFDCIKRKLYINNSEVKYISDDTIIGLDITNGRISSLTSSSEVLPISSAELPIHRYEQKNSLLEYCGREGSPELEALILPAVLDELPSSIINEINRLLEDSISQSDLGSKFKNVSILPTAPDISAVERASVCSAQRDRSNLTLTHIEDGSLYMNARF